MKQLIGPKKQLIYLFACAMAFCFMACSKYEGSPTEGKLSGSVVAWNDKNGLITDKSNITVTIDYPINRSTITDANGKYSFDNLDFDKYDISFSKAGYGTYKIYSYNHSYNIITAQTDNVIPPIAFAQISTNAINSLVLTKTNYNGQPGFTFTVNVSPTPTTLNRSYVRYFLSTSNTVSSSNYLAYTPAIGTSLATATDGFSYDELTGMGFLKGQTIYMKGYGESVRGNDYDDPNLRRRIFPNLNPTSPAPISFVMP